MENSDDPQEDNALVRIKIRPKQFGLLRILKSEINFPSHYIYLDAIELESPAGPITFERLVTNEMNEEWEQGSEDGLWRASVNGAVYIEVGGDCCSPESLKTLLDASGNMAIGRLSFRVNGDSPALEEGTDYTWQTPFRFKIASPKLIHDV